MPVASKLVARLIVVAVAAALFLGATPLVADSKSGTSKVDPSLLAEAKATPDRQFPVTVRGATTPSALKKPAAGAKDNENRERVKKAESAFAGLTGAHRALAIVGGASGTLRGAQIISLSKSPLVDRIVRNESFAVDWIGTDAGAASTEAGIQEINAPATWSLLGASGKGVGVAVID